MRTRLRARNLLKFSKNDRKSSKNWKNSKKIDFFKKNFFWKNVTGSSSNVLGMFDAHLWPLKCSEVAWYWWKVSQFVTRIILVNYEFFIIGFSLCYDSNSKSQSGYFPKSIDVIDSHWMKGLVINERALCNSSKLWRLFYDVEFVPQRKISQNVPSVKLGRTFQNIQESWSNI